MTASGDDAITMQAETDPATDAPVDVAAAAESAHATKTALRLALARRLAEMSEEERHRADAALAEAVLALPEVAAARRVFTCLSFGHEADTWGLVERLLNSGKEVFVPRTEAAGRQLHVHPYPCDLVTLSFGLRQPPPGAPQVPDAEVDATVDVALVLGLAFDRRGYRLGHGAGYFDRFLAGRPFPTVGLAYACQIVDELPVENHDVPLRRVVTDAGPLL
jgi:5,10-methenyltetrahydrofolate synthetase